MREKLKNWFYWIHLKQYKMTYGILMYLCFLSLVSAIYLSVVYTDLMSIVHMFVMVGCICYCYWIMVYKLNLYIEKYGNVPLAYIDYKEKKNR